MKQRICIGVLHGNSGIEKLLNSIGAPWERCSNVKENWKDNFSLIICDKFSASIMNQLENYTTSGGAVLDLCNIVNQYSIHKKWIKQLTADHNNNLTDDLGNIDIYTEVLTHPKAFTAGKTIWINSNETYPYIFCGLPLGSLYMDTGTLQKEFFVNSGRVASEHVSRVSKQKLVHLFMRLLLKLHEMQNIPFVHKWWHPENSDTVCLFRIDSDFATQSEVKELTGFLQSESIPNSWFIHVKAHENWLDQFHNIDNSEIAVHGYQHKVYSSTLQNKKNIREAVKRLTSAGFNPSGYASPYGIWNKTVADSLKDFHFRYTTEFSFAYNSLPLFTSGNSLQLPVHPVCMASLQKAGANETEMAGYFSEVADTQHYFHDPIAFYHHPSDNHLDVWKNVFEKIKNNTNIRFMTFLEWALWWHKRESATPHIFYSDTDNKLFMQLTSNDDTVYLAVHTHGNKFLITRPVQLSLNENQVMPFYNESYRSERITALIKKDKVNKMKLLKSEFFSKLWRL